MPEQQIIKEQSTREVTIQEHVTRAQHVVDSKASHINKPGLIKGALAAGVLFMAAACSPSVPPTPAFSPELTTPTPTASQEVESQKPENSPIAVREPEASPQPSENPLYQKLDIKKVMSLMELGNTQDLQGLVEINGATGDPGSEWVVSQDPSLQKLLSFSLETLRMKGENYKDIAGNFNLQITFPNENTPDDAKDSNLVIATTVNPVGPFAEIKIIGLYSNATDLSQSELRQRLIIVKPKVAFDTKDLPTDTNPAGVSQLDENYHDYLRSLLKLPSNAILPKYGTPKDDLNLAAYTGSFNLDEREVGFTFQPDGGSIYITDQATY